MDTREKLLTAFDIGPDDLAANRRGRLGPRQLRALRRRDLRWAGAWTAGAVVVAGLFAAAPAPLVPVPLVPIPLWTKLVVAVVATALVAAVAVRTAWRARHARRPGVVGCLSGEVTPMLLFRENAGWWLAVQGRTFRAPLDAAKFDAAQFDVAQFDGDLLYHVYYLRRAHRVVALEPVTVDADQVRAVDPAHDADAVPEGTAPKED